MKGRFSVDPISNINPIIPILPLGGPPPEKVEEVSNKVATILSNNGYPNLNIKAYKLFGFVTVWLTLENQGDKESITNILKSNGAVENPINEFLTLDSIEINVDVLKANQALNP